MFRKIFTPALTLMMFVVVVALSSVEIRKSIIATAKEEEKRCGVVTKLGDDLDIPHGAATINNGEFVVLVPTTQAYNRLVVGKEFTFVYRRGELIAIGDGNLCKK